MRLEQAMNARCIHRLGGLVHAAPGDRVIAGRRVDEAAKAVDAAGIHRLL